MSNEADDAIIKDEMNSLCAIFAGEAISISHFERWSTVAPRHNSWSVSVGRERFTGAALNDALEQSVMWKESR